MPHASVQQAVNISVVMPRGLFRLRKSDSIDPNQMHTKLLRSISITLALASGYQALRSEGEPHGNKIGILTTPASGNHGRESERRRIIGGLARLRSPLECYLRTYCHHWLARENKSRNTHSVVKQAVVWLTIWNLSCSFTESTVQA